MIVIYKHKKWNAAGSETARSAKEQARSLRRF